jgi:hypothetical protein
MFSNNTIRQMALSWGAYFAFGKRPDWTNKDQVRIFLINNQHILVWIVNLLKLQLADNFNLIYSTVINNKILFDIFYECFMQIWSNPESLIANHKGNLPIIDKNDKTLIDRIRARIQSKRNLADTSASEFVLADTPESVMAVATVVSTLASVATLVLGIRNFKLR